MNIPTRYRSLRRKKTTEDLRHAATAVPDVPTIPNALSKERVSYETGTNIKIEVISADSLVLVAIGPTTTASALIGILQRQEPRKLGVYRPIMLKVIEFCSNYSLQRELPAYELIGDLVKGWQAGDNCCLRIAVREGIDLSSNAQPPVEYVVPVCGWIKVELKPNKWSKRWAQTENGLLFVSKKQKPKDKDRTLLSNLYLVNFYELTASLAKKLGGPYDVCFALKSPESHAMFENQSKYLQYISCGDSVSYEMWKRAAGSTRAPTLYKASQERQEMYARTTAEQNNGNAPLIFQSDLLDKENRLSPSPTQLNRKVSTSRAGASTRPSLAPERPLPTQAPDHLAITKDSLLDRLINAENIATTSRTLAEDDINRRHSPRLLQANFKSFASRRAGRSSSTMRKESLNLRQSSTVPQQSFRDGNSPGSSFSFSDSDEMMQQQPDRVRRSPYQQTFPTPLEQQQRDEDENMPLYKKLQQLELKSKNPFLDPDTSIPGQSPLQHSLSVKRVNETAMHGESEQGRSYDQPSPPLVSSRKLDNVPDYETELLTPLLIPALAPYHSHSQPALRESWEKYNKHEQEQLLHRLCSQRVPDQAHSDEHLYMNEYATYKHGVSLRDSGRLQRNVSTRSSRPSVVSKPLITVVDEDQRLFHKGSLLAKAYRNGQ
ncbi:hypothetical protein V1512DRAFT_257876 [Lipomyces arxii]|uniref:uncharacterized protein n=1 Tax=Lipomyces arxii TaxID=56418 RepID=UPI0034CD0ECC